MPEPWLKLDTSLVANPKVMTLPGDAFKAWVCILCETKRYNQGDIVPPTPRLSFTLHLKLEAMEPIIVRLADAGLLDWDASINAFRVHDWEDWQRRYPSDSKENQNERQRRSRASRQVTNGHDYRRDIAHETYVTSRHEGHESHEPRLDESREEEIREEERGIPPDTPPSRSLDSPDAANRHSRSRASGESTRGKRIPQDWPLTEELLQHGMDQGIDQAAIDRWHQGFHEHFMQTTKNPTSMNWTFREKSRMTSDIRDGKLVPTRIPNSPPSRAQEPVVTGLPELTPSEQTYKEFLAVVQGAELGPEDVSEETLAVVTTLGGWDAFTGETPRAPPRFPEWVGAWNRSQRGFPGA
jgi:hypothetical protein